MTYLRFRTQPSQARAATQRRSFAEAFVATNGEQDGRLGRLLLNPRSSWSIRFEEFRKRLKPLRSALPYDLADVLTQDAVAELLRVNRNSVRPTRTWTRPLRGLGGRAG